MDDSESVKIGTLSNGLEVLICEVPHVRSVNVFLWVKRGTRCDPAGYSGLTHLLEHLLLRGAIPGLGDLADSVEGRGGEVDGAVYQDFMRLNLTLDARDVRFGLEALAGLLRRGPDLCYFDSEKRVVVEEIREILDVPENKVMGAATRLLPPGTLVAGDPDECYAITPEILQAYWNSVAVNELLLTVVSPFPHANVLATAEAIYGDLCIPTAERRVGGGDPNSHATASSPLTIIRQRGTQQNYVAIGFALKPLSLEDYFALQTCEALLCRGAGARLFRVLRDAGLIYDLVTDVDFGVAPRLYIGTSTAPENVLRVVSLLMTELHQLHVHGIPENEWQRAAHYCRGQHLIMLDEPINIGKFAALLYLAYGCIPEPQLLYHLDSDENRARVQRILAELVAPQRRSLAVLTSGRALELMKTLPQLIM